VMCLFAVALPLFGVTGIAMWILRRRRRWRSAGTSGVVVAASERSREFVDGGGKWFRLRGSRRGGPRVDTARATPARCSAGNYRVADGDHGHAALYATMSRVGYLSMILADGAARNNLQ
jgi:hypothetical protein